MCLKPMNFSKTNCTITQLNLSYTFQLSPAPLAESPAQDWKNTNATADGDCFNLSNLSDDFKIHQPNIMSGVFIRFNRRPTPIRRPNRRHELRRLQPEAQGRYARAERGVNGEIERLKWQTLVEVWAREVSRYGAGDFLMRSAARIGEMYGPLRLYL